MRLLRIVEVGTSKLPSSFRLHQHSRATSGLTDLYVNELVFVFTIDSYESFHNSLISFAVVS